MSVHGIQLIFTQQFMDDLDAVLNWLDEHSTWASAKFVAELNEFVKNRIAKFPESHMEYPWKRTPQRLYRRAIFKKKWYIVFKLEGNEIELLVLYHQKPGKYKDLPLSCFLPASLVFS